MYTSISVQIFQYLSMQYLSMQYLSIQIYRCRYALKVCAYTEKKLYSWAISIKELEVGQ